MNNSIVITYDRTNDCLNIEYDNSINNIQLKKMYERIINMILNDDTIKSIY